MPDADARCLDMEKKLPSDAVQESKFQKRRAPNMRPPPYQKAKADRSVTGLCHILIFHLIVIQRLHRIFDELCSL